MPVFSLGYRPRIDAAQGIVVVLRLCSLKEEGGEIMVRERLFLCRTGVRVCFKPRKLIRSYNFYCA